MDVPLVIKQRLNDLGREQGDLAAAAKVTESYISQLLNRRKLPPAPNRTDIYEKMERFLKLPAGELARLATIQRKEALKGALQDPPPPLHKEVRELILRKCPPEKANAIREIFERHPFGEMERLVTQKLLDVVKNVAKEELDSENWVHLVARLSGRSYEQMRVIILEFLDTDIFSVTAENVVSFLDPLIESWDMDLTTFAMEIVLTRRLVPEHLKRFEFVETESFAAAEEPGFKEFLRDSSLSGDATEQELAFLRNLRFVGRKPKPLYYYRELQNLRDPLHFSTPPKSASRVSSRAVRESSVAPMQKLREAEDIEDQMKAETRQAAVVRWTKNTRRRNHRKNRK